VPASVIKAVRFILDLLVFVSDDVSGGRSADLSGSGNVTLSQKRIVDKQGKAAVGLPAAPACI
jgi:hypothetical protein